MILDHTDFEFDASAKKITIVNTDLLGNLSAQNLLMVTNVTDGQIIYDFGCDGFTGTFGYDTVTFEYDTTSMSDTDDLQIICHIPDPDSENSKLLEAIKLQIERSEEIIQQLKINNFHLSLITQVDINETNI